MVQRHRRAALALVLVAGLGLAACGNDDDDTASDTTVAEVTETSAEAATETTAAEVTETTAEAATETTAAGGAAVDAATRVAAFQKPLTDLPFNEPISGGAPKAKKAYYVQCSVPVCEEIRTGLDAATKALGWTLETTAHKDTPDTVAAAFDAAIAAKPDVVFTSGNPREWFATQLEQLQSSNVPVVAWSMPEGYEPGSGITANLLSGDDYYFYGVLMADYAAVNTTSKRVMFVGLPTFPVLSLVQQGFQDEIAKACPDCNVDTFEIAVTDIGTNLPGQVVSKLQADKELDFIAYAFGGMLFGVPEALDAANLTAQSKAVSQAGGPLNFGFIAADKHQMAEVGLASELLGWRAVDVAARVLAGGSAGRSTAPAEAAVDGHPDILANGLPLQLLEKGSIADPTALWPGVEGFQDQFKQLWGV